MLPVPRAAYTAPMLTPITEGDARYPVAHAIALLVQARPHCPADLAATIGEFLHADPSRELPPPTPTTGDLPADEDEIPDFPPAGRSLEAFARMPGSLAGTRAQTGPVMPVPPPPKPSFVPPTPQHVYRPAYSNGCSHPGHRLQRNGRGVTCLDCSTEFPDFAAP